MKQTWKKIASLMLVVICAMSMMACGNNEEEAYKLITDDMVESSKSISTSVIEALGSFDEATLEENKANRDDFTRLSVIEWSEETATLGALVSVGEPVAEVDMEEAQVTVVVPAVFENSEGQVSVVFDYDKDYDQMLPSYITVSEAETFAGNMSGAAVNTIMGIGTVFAVLVFLILVISLFKYVNKIGTKKAAPKAAAQAPKAAPAPAAAPVVEENLVDDLELVAVIAAAIAAAENTSTDSFVVRSIRKVNRSKWQRA